MVCRFTQKSSANFWSIPSWCFSCCRCSCWSFSTPESPWRSRGKAWPSPWVYTAVKHVPCHQRPRNQGKPADHTQSMTDPGARSVPGPECPSSRCWVKSGLSFSAAFTVTFIHGDEFKFSGANGWIVHYIMLTTCYIYWCRNATDDD